MIRYALDVYTRPNGGSWDTFVRDHAMQEDALSDLRGRIRHHHALGRVVIRRGAVAVAYDATERRVMLRVRRVDDAYPVTWHPMRWHHVAALVETVTA